MKTLFVNPPFYRLLGSHFNNISIGIASISAVLREHDFETTIYNSDHIDSHEYPGQEDIFNSYDNYLSVIQNPEHELWREIQDVISGQECDILALSATTATIHSCEIIAHNSKKYDPDLTVVLGGVHPTITPETCLKNTDFDYIMRGESECTFLEFLQGKKLSEIDGLSYKNPGMIHNPERGFIKDLDTLPFPDRDSYINNKKFIDYGYIMTARGCNHHCTFCASEKMWHRKVRFRSPENILEEVKFLYFKYNQDTFYFIDDTFTLNKSRTKKFCELLIKEGLPITYICDTRLDSLDSELLSFLKKSGCRRLKCGIESGNDETLRRIRKNITTKEIKNKIELISKVGIDVSAYIMINFPWEGDKEILNTISFAKSLNCRYYSLSILSPYIGTEIYKEFKNLPKDNYHYLHQNVNLLPDNISKEVVEKFFALNGENNSRL